MEAAWIAELSSFEEEVADRLERGDDDGARDLLTSAVENRLLEALELGDALAGAVEAQVVERFGIPMPDHPSPEGATWRPESEPMELPPDAASHLERIHCYVAGLDDYPRPHQSYGNRQGELNEPGAGSSR